MRCQVTWTAMVPSTWLPSSSMGSCHRATPLLWPMASTSLPV